MSEQKSVYLAGKQDAGELGIDRFSVELEARGHTVLEKWWELGILPKPYLDHIDTSSPAAVAMIHAAYESDVMVLFPDKNILGAAVEFGAAIASTQVNPAKEIFVVDAFDTRQSIFYAHPSVMSVRGLTAIRQRDWY